MQSNPCVEPIFDETIEAPSRFKIKRNGKAKEIENLHLVPYEKQNNRTIGTIRNHVSHKPLSGLFDAPGEDGTSDTQAPPTEEEEDPERMGITAAVLI